MWSFLAETKQLYEWFSQSICLSVHPSVPLFITAFSLCSNHCIIMKFSGVITIDRSDSHAKCQGQRSKEKVTEVKTQFSHFWIVTPVWIHIWWWNDAQSFIWHKTGALFFRIIRQISRSHRTKNCWFWPKFAFHDCKSSFNSHDAQSLK